MNKILKNIITIGVIIIVIIIVSNLKIKNINVSGNENVESSHVIKNIVRSDYDRYLIIFLFKNTLFKNMDIPLIETYDIKLKALCEVEIIVKETVPILYMKADIKRVLIDKKGYVVNFSDKIENLPELSGINYLPPKKGERIQVDGEIDFIGIINIVSILNVNGINIDLIEINREKELSLYIGKITVNFGTIDYIDTKVDRLIRIYDKIKDYKGILDLRNVRENDENEEYIFKKIN